MKMDSSKTDDSVTVQNAYMPSIVKLEYNPVYEEQHMKCSVCNHSFKSLAARNRHLRNLHQVEPAIAHKRKLKCPMCSECTKSYTDFDEHLTTKHRVTIMHKTLQFSSFKTFREWKSAEERDTHSSYVVMYSYSRNGQKLLKYRCHRSGQYVPRQKGERLRKPKSKGSNKINCTCPSRVTATEKRNGKVLVEYVPTHVGHKQEVDRLRLNTAERETIAKKLLEGIPKDRILKDLKSNCNPTNRISFVTRRDILNIQRSFNLPNKSEVQIDSADVQNYSTNDNKPVEELKTSSDISIESPEVEDDQQVLLLLPSDPSVVCFNSLQPQVLCQDSELVVIDSMNEADLHVEVHCNPSEDSKEGLLENTESGLRQIESEKLIVAAELQALLNGVQNCNSLNALAFIRQSVAQINAGLECWEDDDGEISTSDHPCSQNSTVTHSS